MATNTTNLALIKPSGTDKIRIAQINSNMDVIDAKIGPVGSTSLQAQVTDIKNKLDDRQFYNSVTDLGLTAGEASVVSVWAAMANNSIGVFPGGDFATGQVPNTQGAVIMHKNTVNRGSIEYFRRYQTIATTDRYATMGIDGNNVATGEWIFPYALATTTAPGLMSAEDKAAIASSAYYASGDRYTTGNNYFSMVGIYVTRTAHFTLHVPKSLENISTISIDTFKGIIGSQTEHYVGTSTNFDWTTAEGITLSAIKFCNYAIRISVTFSSSVGSNGYPVFFAGQFGITFT